MGSRKCLAEMTRRDIDRWRAVIHPVWETDHARPFHRSRTELKWFNAGVSDAAPKNQAALCHNAPKAAAEGPTR
jgi:hypothetical protein